MKIKELVSDEKPRERLIKYGAEYLSNEELLAIILRCGTKEASSKELASRIISEYGGLENLKNVSVNKLNTIKGMGNAKSSEVIAALELGRRVHYIKSNYSTPITNTKEVYDTYRGYFDGELQEKFCALYLDTKRKVIKFKEIFKGTLDATSVHPREVFKEAIKLSASVIICMHNHPSGDATPSTEDIEVTNALITSGEMLGIKLVDHIIFGNNYFYSFYESMNKK